RATMNAAEAKRKVIAEKNKKEAEVLSMKIAAYGTGEDYITAQLYAKIMPQIRSIIFNGAQNSVFGLPIAMKGSGEAPKTAPKAAEPPKETKQETAPAEKATDKTEGGAE
ncbi:MAG: hypothetical protein J5833_06215, partial [Victivallales bacterium]|nr:hypothetical protein [Victivallales bacterium]